ncbi:MULTISPECIES: hypothetical protein [Nitrospira]|uniref:Uncharacterized protein n=2 Tax=Nitrospira TaxID=1234 RepID=A0AA86T763_9BACT|nr:MULTISPECIES: hypothetical protein [Nitrospira]CAE6784200.1 conserved hypothetical protein [Nitrospira defluvii]CAI4031593.1 hypothetical protein DNFV4_02012 [Nitrospira tepida]
MLTGEVRSLDILDDGQLQRLDYDGLLRFHRGDATWGAAVAFRALQRAGRHFSHPTLWERRELTVTSAHPGPGVRDAVEYVTGCVSRGRYYLTQPEQAGQCHNGMQFAWWISKRLKTVSVQLREGFVPEDFFILVDRIDTSMERASDRGQFEHMKAQLTDQVWREPLDTLFRVTDTMQPTGATVLACTN